MAMPVNILRNGVVLAGFRLLASADANGTITIPGGSLGAAEAEKPAEEAPHAEESTTEHKASRARGPRG